MNCKFVLSKITFLPRGELPYEEGLELRRHLASCADCNKEYHQYLKMFYLIDKTKELNIPKKIHSNFTDEVNEKIESSNLKRNKYLKWYIAAAILIFALIMIPINQTNHQSETNNISEVTINELLQKEDWQSIMQKFTEGEFSDELIPIALILSKLNQINYDQANYQYAKNFSSKKDLNDLIQLLSNYQRMNDYISTQQISNYILNRQGETS